jgi:hypothetical protein
MPIDSGEEEVKGVVGSTLRGLLEIKAREEEREGERGEGDSSKEP